MRGLVLALLVACSRSSPPPPAAMPACVDICTRAPVCVSQPARRCYCFADWRAASPTWDKATGIECMESAR